MAKSTLQGKFFQFPIGVLGLMDESNPQAALYHVVRNSLVEVSETADCESEMFNEVVYRYLERYNIDCDLDFESDYAKLLYAAETLNVRIPDDENSFRMEESRKVIGKAELRGAAKVRMPATIVWECIAGAFPVFSFKVLAAVYSVIGSADAKIVRRELLQARVHGYDSPKQSSEHVPVGKLRYALDKLEERSFFFRVCPDKRTTYYGRNLKLLIEAASNIVVSKQRKKKAISRSSKNALLLAAIDQKKAKQESHA